MLYKLIIVVLFLLILYHLYTNKKIIEGYKDSKCWEGTKSCTSSSKCNISNLKILECQNKQLKELNREYQTLPLFSRIERLEALYCIKPNKNIVCIEKMLVSPDEIKEKLLNGVPETTDTPEDQKNDVNKNLDEIELRVAQAEADAK